jgi:outer membrane protein OmpA-like peptidoglycan-associated protein
MKTIYLWMSLFVCTYNYAQTKNYTLSLYYNVNEVEPIGGFQKIDSINKIQHNSSCKISIYGYADFLSSDLYNITLSQKRADKVKNYIIAAMKTGNLQIVRCQGIGEKNSKNNDSNEGEPLQRRVDICIVEKAPIKSIENRKAVTPDAKKNQDQKNEISNLEESSVADKLENLRKGESITVDGLTFIPGRHIPLPSAVPVLKDLLEMLKENPDLKIEIRGHICCSADGFDSEDLDTGTKNLSHMRAFTVYSYLVKHGIEKERLKYKGYGGSEPKIKIERTVEDQQANRRVEIRVLEN